MAVTRAQKVRLGIFVAVGLAVLVGGLLVLAGMKLGEKRDLYSVRFSDANASLNGLEVGSPVKYSGIRIGRVESIKVDPEDVSTLVVELSLEGGTPVAEDSVASAGSMGITGLKYIELSRGSRSARKREPGETIPAGVSLIDELSDKAAVITAKLEQLVDNLNAITTPEMRGKVASVLDNTNQLLRTADATVEENRANLKGLGERIARASVQVEELTRELKGTTLRVNGLLDSASPKVETVLVEAAALAGELRHSREQLDQTLAAARAAMGEEGVGKTLKSADRLMERGYLVLVQSQEEIETAVERLRETSENLSVFSQRIKDDPSLLLLGGGEERGLRRESDR